MSKKNKSRRVKTGRVKLIVNPGAGKAENTSANLKLVTGSLEKNGFKADVAWARPKEEATSIARRAVKDGYKTVIAMGGDGTIEAVMRGMVDRKARLGIVPVGTQNNIAKSLGIPEDLEEACALIASGDTHKLDMGQVKTKKGKKFVFFELATVGLTAAIYPDTNKIANGKLSKVKEAALNLFKHETRPTVFLTMNGESKVKIETMMVLVSNTPIFGKNFMVAPGASLQDGLLDISVYPDFSKFELLRYYAEVMDGGYSGNGKVHTYQVRKLKVKTSPRLDVMADGVDLGKGTIKIKVLPGALRVIAPKSSPYLDSSLKEKAEITPEQVASVEGKGAPEASAIVLG